MTGFNSYDLSTVQDQLSNAGFKLLSFKEEYPVTKFSDIGAVAVFLRAIPWQIPGFTIEGYKEKLFKLHKKIQPDGRRTELY